MRLTFFPTTISTNFPSGKKNLAETLDGAVKGSFVIVGGRLTSHVPIRYGNNHGRAFSYLYVQDGKIYKVSARVLLIGKRLYQLSVLMEEKKFDSEKATQFLDSFRLVSPDGDLPPRPSVEPKKPK